MYASVILFAVFQVIASQDPPGPGDFNLPANFPQRCLRPPKTVTRPFECCKIPKFFDDADFEACGFQKINDDEERPRMRGPHDCSQQNCILRKYNLIKEDESIDEENITKFLDEWAGTNPEFKPALTAAKENCLGRELPGPPRMCNANKLVFCVSNSLFGLCPTWQDTEDCAVLKSHMEECRPLFRQ